MTLNGDQDLLGALPHGLQPDDPLLLVADNAGQSPGLPRDPFNSAEPSRSIQDSPTGTTSDNALANSTSITDSASSVSSDLAGSPFQSHQGDPGLQADLLDRFERELELLPGSSLDLGAGSENGIQRSASADSLTGLIGGSSDTASTSTLIPGNVSPLLADAVSQDPLLQDQSSSWATSTGAHGELSSFQPTDSPASLDSIGSASPQAEAALQPVATVASTADSIIVDAAAELTDPAGLAQASSNIPPIANAAIHGGEDLLIAPASQIVVNPIDDHTHSSLEQALKALDLRIGNWVSDSVAYTNLLNQLFATDLITGEAWERSTKELAERLLIQGLQLPLQIIADAGLSAHGIRAGYIGQAHPKQLFETDTSLQDAARIIIDGDWLAAATSEEIEAVLLEEVGHAIDHALNGLRDQPGDEGERFSALIRGQKPADTAQAENDNRYILLNSQLQSLESASVLLALPRPSTIVAVDLDSASSSPGGEQVTNAFDGNSATKYLNFGKQNSGARITYSVPTRIQGFVITTANDSDARDPSSYVVSGRNNDSSQWIQVSAGALALPTARRTPGAMVVFTNDVAYTQYQIVFPTVRNSTAANSMQLAELAFYGDQVVNSAPTIISSTTDAVGALTEDASSPTLSDSGVIVFSDIDLADAHQATVTSGVGNTVGGSLVLGLISESSTTEQGSVAWTYSVANSVVQSLGAGQQATETFTVKISDGLGGAVNQIVTVTITGSNDVATLASAAAALTESDAVLTTTGTLALSDRDANAAAVVAQSTNGTYGTFAIDANGNWSYSSFSAQNQLDAGQVVTEVFVVSTTDGGNAAVTVSITGSNDQPVLSSGVLYSSITELNEGHVLESTYGHSRNGSIDLLDPDGGDRHTISADPAGLNYRGSFTPSFVPATDGKGAALAWIFTVSDADLDGLDAGQVVTQVYTLTLKDAAGASDSRVITINLNGSADIPVAARFDTVQGQAIDVSLPSGMFNSNASIDAPVFTLEPLHVAGVSYAVPTWLSIDGRSGRLSGNPTASEVGDHTMAVVVTDQAGGRSVGYFTISVANLNDAPLVTSQAQPKLAVTEDQPMQLNISSWFADADQGLRDADGSLLDGLTYEVKLAQPDSGGRWSWFSLDQANGDLRLSPGNEDVGQTALQIRATDRTGVSAYITTVVTITNSNDAPELNPLIAASFSRRSLVEDNAFQVAIPSALFLDPDQRNNPGERLQLSVLQADGSPLPEGWQFDASTGLITGSSVGLLGANLRIAANDQNDVNAATNHILSLDVARVATAPIVALLNEAPEVLEGGSLILKDSLTISNADPGSERLTIRLKATSGPAVELVRLIQGNASPQLLAPSADGWWDVESLDGLTLRTSNPDVAGTVTLTITATSTERLGGDSVSTTQVVTATFSPVADAPSWVAMPQNGAPVLDPLTKPSLNSHLVAELQDKDGSESLAYQLSWNSDRPNLRIADAAGTELGIRNGTAVVLSAADWSKAILLEDGGLGQPLEIRVMPVATEAGNADSRNGEAQIVRWAPTPQLGDGAFAISPRSSVISRYDGGTAIASQRAALDLDLSIPAGARSIQLEFVMPTGSVLSDGAQALTGSPVEPQAGVVGERVVVEYDLDAVKDAKPWDQISVVAPEGFRGEWKASTRLLSSARPLSAKPFDDNTWTKDLAAHLAVDSQVVDLNLTVLAQARKPTLSASYDPTTQNLTITLQRGQSSSGSFDGDEALSLVVRGIPDGLILVDANNKPVGASDAYGTTVLINRDAVEASQAGQPNILELSLFQRDKNKVVDPIMAGTLSLSLTALLPGTDQAGDSRSVATSTLLDIGGQSPTRALNIVDPLVLDLSGDGLPLVDVQGSPVSFDMLGLGLPFTTGWLGANVNNHDDAFLVADRNGDGKITSISEMLSEYFATTDGQRTAASGLDALAQSFDKNKDTKVDAADGETWNDLKLWFDDGDGVTEGGELIALSNYLSSIDLSSGRTVAPQPTWAAGNQILRSAAVSLIDSGIKSSVYDVGLLVALAPTPAEAPAIELLSDGPMAEDSFGSKLTITSAAIDLAIQRGLSNESVLVRLMGLPDAVIPNIGVKDQRGDWLFTWKELQQQAQQLTLASTSNWSGSSNLQLIASQILPDGGVVGSTLISSTFTVTPVADSPILRLQAASMDEDGSMALRELVRQVGLRDNDLSERLSFVLKADASYSLWQGSSQALAIEGDYQLTDLDGWTIRAASQFAGNIALTLKATASEIDADGPSATASTTMTSNLQVVARADTPTLSLGASSLSLQEGGELLLSRLHLESSTADSSEDISVRLDCLPAGIVLESTNSSGNPRITANRNSDGTRSFTFALNELPALRLRDVLGEAPDSFEMKVSTISRERSNGDQAMDAATTSGIANTVTVQFQRHARPAAVVLNQTQPLPEDASRWTLSELVSITPAATTDKLQVILSGLSQQLMLKDSNGAPLSADETGRLRLDSLTGVQLVPQANVSGTLNIGIEVISQAVWGGRQAASTPKSLNLAIMPVADTPQLEVPGIVFTPSDTGWLDLSEVQLKLADNDGSEMGELLIRGLPQGLKASDFNRAVEWDGNSSSWRIPAAQLANLQVLLPDLDQDLTLTLTPQSIETATGDRALGASQTIRVIGAAPARVPLLSGGDLVTDEDTPVLLLRDSGGVIQGQLQGNTNQQQLSYRITLLGDANGTKPGSFVRWDSGAGFWRPMDLDATKPVELSAADWQGVAWRPSSDASGEMTLKVEGISSNRLGETAISEAMMVRAVVRQVNDAPEILQNLGDRGLAVGTNVDLDLGTSFRDRDPSELLNYSVSLSQRRDNQQLLSGTWLTVRNGRLQGIPTNADLGSWDVEVRASDSSGQTVSQLLRWVVGDSNQAPIVKANAPTSINITQNNVLSLDFGSLFGDANLNDGDQLTFSIRTPGRESITWLQTAIADLGQDQILTAPTDNSLVGSRDLIIRATDRQGLSAEHRLSLVVSNINDAPQVQRPSAVATLPGVWEEQFQIRAGSPLKLDLTNLFQDPDQLYAQASPSVRISTQDGKPVPSWVHWNADTAQWEADPGRSDGGLHTIRLIATDPGNLSAEYRLLLNVNNRPEIAIGGPALVQEFETAKGLTLQLQDFFTDPDQGDQLRVRASIYVLHNVDGAWTEDSTPLQAEWVTQNAQDELTLTPSRVDAGRYRLHLQASDANNASISQFVDLEVIATNTLPQVKQVIAPIRSADNQIINVNLAEFFTDIDLSNPVGNLAERLSFSYTLISGDRDWFSTSLNGEHRYIDPIQLRDSSSDDPLFNNLLQIALPGVSQLQQSILRLWATDASGATVFQDVELTIEPRVQLPTLAPLTSPNPISQLERVQLGSLVSTLPQLIDPEGDVLSLLIRTLPGVDLLLPKGFAGQVDKLEKTSSFDLEDGRQIEAQAWRIQLNSTNPDADLRLLPELGLQLAADSGLRLPGTGEANGSASLIALPVELRLEASLRPVDGAISALPPELGDPQLRWVTIQNQPPEFNWGARARFIQQEIDTEARGVFSDLKALFMDPDDPDRTDGTGIRGWQVTLPSRLQGLLELDQNSGELRWIDGAKISSELAGSHRIIVEATDAHYALGNRGSIARGVIQLTVKAPGAPASAFDDLITRLNDLAKLDVNNGRSWVLFQPVDVNSAEKNMLATSENLGATIEFLDPTQALASLPSGLKVDGDSSKGGLDPISYSIATDQPGGWYSIVDFAVPEQDARNLIVMKGYDADTSTSKIELAYQSFHSRYLSFDLAAQTTYAEDFGTWLKDQTLSISTYESDAKLISVSESELLSPDKSKEALASLPKKDGRRNVDGSALLIDSDGDGMVDYIRLLLIDNGVFDLDHADGNILDPFALIPVTQASSNDSGSQNPPGSKVEVNTPTPLNESPPPTDGKDVVKEGMPKDPESNGGTDAPTPATSPVSTGSSTQQLGPDDTPLNSSTVGEAERQEDTDGDRSDSALVDIISVEAANVGQLYSLEIQETIEETKEAFVELADSLKEAFSKLLGKNDLVSSKLLGGLLAPAGGSSVVDRLLKKLSPSDAYRMRKRDRKLRGYWRLGHSGHILYLSEGRVRLIDPNWTINKSALGDLPELSDVTAPSISTSRLLSVLLRSSAPTAAPAMLQQQLQTLLLGTTTVNWSVWLQTLPQVLAIPSRLGRWRAHVSIQHLKQELDRLSAIDPSLADVFMAAELITCLQIMEVDHILPDFDNLYPTSAESPNTVDAY